MKCHHFHLSEKCRNYHFCLIVLKIFLFTKKWKWPGKLVSKSEKMSREDRELFFLQIFGMNPEVRYGQRPWFCKATQLQNICSVSIFKRVVQWIIFVLSYKSTFISHETHSIYSMFLWILEVNNKWTGTTFSKLRWSMQYPSWTHWPRYGSYPISNWCVMCIHNS